MFFPEKKDPVPFYFSQSRFYAAQHIRGRYERERESKREREIIK